MRLAAVLAAATLALDTCASGAGTAHGPRASAGAPSPTVALSLLGDGLGGVFLGGRQERFVAAFGTPEARLTTVLPANGEELRIDHFAQCPGADIPQLIVVFDRGRAAMITRQSCAGTPSVENRRAEATSFFPSDAPARGAGFTTHFGQPALMYESPTLDRVLPHSWFSDCRANPVRPGTFSLVFTLPGWQLVAGTCP